MKLSFYYQNFYYQNLNLVENLMSDLIIRIEKINVKTKIIGQIEIFFLFLISIFSHL